MDHRNSKQDSNLHGVGCGELAVVQLLNGAVLYYTPTKIRLEEIAWNKASFVPLFHIFIFKNKILVNFI